MLSFKSLLIVTSLIALSVLAEARSKPGAKNRGVTGKYQSAKKLMSQLEPGDLVEVNAKLYQHWGVYLGKEGKQHMIIHVTGDVQSGLGAVVGTRDTFSDVRKEQFKKAIGDKPCRVNNAIDAKYKPFNSKKIIERAESKLGEHKYNVLHSNCEHWANWCRSGHKVSLQAQKALNVIEDGKDILQGIKHRDSEDVVENAKSIVGNIKCVFGNCD